MTDARRPEPLTATVLRTRRLTPSMVRVVLGGDGLRDLADPQHADSYVKLVLGPVDQPRRRSYTVRDWDRDARELTLDVVVHGDVGLAGPWAAAARPGDTVPILGPGGAYSPDPTADWHLLVGDESALPAIAVAVARLPADARAVVLVEVDGPEHEVPLDAPDGADLRWVHRRTEVVGRRLVREVLALDWPPGRVHVFLHGEAGMVRDVRRHLRADRGVTTGQLSASGYWRLGTDDEGWRATKKVWNAEIEQSEATLG